MLKLLRSPWTWFFVFLSSGALLSCSFWFVLLGYGQFLNGPFNLSDDAVVCVLIGFIIGGLFFAYLWGYYHFWN